MPLDLSKEALAVHEQRIAGEGGGYRVYTIRFADTANHGFGVLAHIDAIEDEGKALAERFVACWNADVAAGAVEKYRKLASGK